MLTSHLQKTLDKKWNNCWPVSDLRPVALLDLISYIFFIKKLDDWDLIHQKENSIPFENFIYSKEIKEFTWSKFQNLTTTQIHELFIKEYGIFELMKVYANTNLLYSDFFKAPLLITPTPKLIFNAIEIVNIIETSNKITQSLIVEYLFGKSKITSQNSREFIPEYISRLMVSIARPSSMDIVKDSAVGNGNLLVNVHQFIGNHNPPAVQTLENFISDNRLIGIETDLSQLRLSAMNLALHGIKLTNVFKNSTNPETATNRSTLYISDLLFPNEYLPIGDSEPESRTLKRENLILKEILDTIHDDSRAVILVPKTFLKSENPDLVKTRKNILDHCNLEGVITLMAMQDSIYSEAAILVFNKSGSVPSSNIWFCKWSDKGKSKLNAANRNAQEIADMKTITGSNEILNQWENRNDKTISRNSFFIPDNYIKTNNYSFVYNDYKLIRQDQPADSVETINEWIGKEETIVSANKENLKEFYEESIPLPKEKKRRKASPLVIILITLVIGGAAFYWLYVKKNIHSLFSGTQITNAQTKFQQPTVETDVPSDTANISPLTTTQVNQQDIIDSSQTPQKYTVIKKAWFHYEPDPGKLKPLYLVPRKDVVLTSTEEENGFIYVVYVNSRGGKTHGWLNKKNLQPVD